MRLLFSLIICLFSAFAIAAETAATISEESAVDQRIAQEKSTQALRFSITPHKPTYLLPITFNNNIQSYHVYNNDIAQDKQQQFEAKFQFSFKMPILTDIAEIPLSVYFGYTQVSFWQAYNSGNSSPFRETNYEPEVFAVWYESKELAYGWNFKLATLNLTHQSNGQSEPLSRSWNRLEGNLVFEKGHFTLAINPWYRFSESASDDDNPDLLDYYGHGKIRATYKTDNNVFTITSCNNLESGLKKGALEFNWSFPIHEKVQGYFQLFTGYGNSLIEYNEYTNTLGLGISVTNWL